MSRSLVVFHSRNAAQRLFNRYAGTADLLAYSKTLSYSADGNSVLLQVPHHHCGDTAGAAAAGAAIGPAIGTIVGSIVVFRQLAVEYCMQR